jgi:hypothetical protein
MEPLERTICQHLRGYLSGETSLDVFVDWFVGVTWNIEQTASPEVRDFVYAIELVLAEASSGLLTPDQLRTELRALSEHAVLEPTPGT